jgi:outer membrane protein TolC
MPTIGDPKSAVRGTMFFLLRAFVVIVLCLCHVGCLAPHSTLTNLRPNNNALSNPLEPKIQRVNSVAIDAAPTAAVSNRVLPHPSTSVPNQSELTNAQLTASNGILQQTMPIDLATVVRLVDERSPAIRMIQARMEEAQARLDKAEAMWLPNLSVGANYNRFDGQTQNQRGDVFGVSRANLFGGVSPTLSIDIGEAIYRPLIERRLSFAENLRSKATKAQTELEATSVYLDLLQYYVQLEINRESLQKAEDMWMAAANAKDAKLDRTPGDINRAKAEVLLRKSERLDLQIKANHASGKLVRLLVLPPNIKLVPCDMHAIPIYIVHPNITLDQLLSSAISNRPDLAANRELIAAAWDKVRHQQLSPIIPKLSLTNQTGIYGGGLNDDLQKFESRNALSLQLFWEVRSLGFANRAETAEKKAQFDQLQYQYLDDQAKAASEIVEAALISELKHQSLELSKSAVQEATELYRINKEGTLNVVDAKNLFDALRPLQAIQVLNQARISYLSAVIEFNRAQFRLFTLIGKPTGFSSIPNETSTFGQDR